MKDLQAAESFLTSKPGSVDVKIRNTPISQVKIEGEEDNRRKREQELKTLINEKRLLLER